MKEASNVPVEAIGTDLFGGIKQGAQQTLRLVADRKKYR